MVLAPMVHLSRRDRSTVLTDGPDLPGTHSTSHEMPVSQLSVLDTLVHTLRRRRPFAAVIGVRKKPKVERGPKLIIPIRQPLSRMISGVRQVARRVDIRQTAAATGRATGFSTIGRLITAEATPKNTDSHQTRL